MRLILASTSPRRKELLALLGYPFDVVPPAFTECLTPGQPADTQAREFAFQKAASCAAREPDATVLGSDTVIALDEEVIGKPRDLRDAEIMLRRLMGRRHVIYTAVALVQRRHAVQDVAVASVCVWMKRWDDAQLTAYIESAEGLGKAGAYSIQGVGGQLVERIEGDFTAAVGLPIQLVATMLNLRGVGPLTDVEQLYHTRPYPNWNRFPS